MVAACASNFRPPLQRDPLFRFQSEKFLMNNVSLVKNTTFPLLRADIVNRKPRFMVICMSYGIYVALCRGTFDVADSGGEDGPILEFQKVMKEAEARGVILTPDMVEAAKSTGIPKKFLLRYLCVQQGLGWGLGFAMQLRSMSRNQMMIDTWYLIQLGIKFSFNVFVDFMVANVMNKRGSRCKEIVSYLLKGLVTKAVMCTLVYYARHLRHLQTSSILLQEYRHDISMFGAKMLKLLGEILDWAAIFCLGLIVILFDLWKKHNYSLSIFI